MPQRTFFTLLLLSFLAACASPPPTPVPTTQTAPPPEVDSANWWRTAVFYEIFVRSYYDTDGDGIGDFNGVAEKLDYLDSLGVDALWLMPIHPSPSYHGYDITNYYNVNPDYGSMDDFKNLLNEAHKRDMRVIIDLVLNHTSNRHPWFTDANSNPESPYRNFYLWGDAPANGYWHSGQHGYYYGFFWEGMPDLDYTNPAVTEAMLDTADFWLNDVGVDGFRVDAVKHLIEEDGRVENTPATHAWLKEYFAAYKTQNPQAYSVGEVYNAGAFMAKMYSEEELDQIFNFEISNGIMDSVQSGVNTSIVSALKFAQKDLPSHNYATFLTNHDQNRAMSAFDGDVDKAKSAAFLLFTLPGTPYIYYGEEIGMQGVKPDEDIRLPMQWSADEFTGFSTAQPWRNPYNDYAQINVAAQADVPASLLEHYRALIRLRKNHPALQTGDIILLETGNSGIFAGLRVDANETLLILANLTGESISDYALALNAAGLAESTIGVETLFGEKQARVPERGAKVFRPYEMMVLKFIP